MNVKAWGKTDVGLKREINQDTILLAPEHNLFVVADGMGGHKGGEVASALAVAKVKEVFTSADRENFSPKDLMIRAYREASAGIFYKSTEENLDLQGMGTTMVVAYCSGNQLFIGNVGDSRAYLIKNKTLWQITEDHSLVNEQVRAGVIREEDAHLMVSKNVITRSVGFEHNVLVDIVVRDLKPGEKILICSDGLCGMVANENICSLCSNFEGQALVDECIEAAKAEGGDDNISVVVIEVS